jgi:hypothetical protein
VKKVLRKGFREPYNAKPDPIQEPVTQDHLLMKSAMPAFIEELVAIQEDLEKKAFQPGYAGSVFNRGASAVGNAVHTGTQQVGHAAAAWAHPRKSFKEGWQATFHPNGKPLGLGWKAFMGYGLVTGLNSAVQKKDPSGQGKSRVRRLLNVAGDQAGGIIGAPYGLAGGIGSSLIGQKIGDTVGAGLERLVGYRPRPQPHLPPPPTGVR